MLIQHIAMSTVYPVAHLLYKKIKRSRHCFTRCARHSTRQTALASQGKALQNNLEYRRRPLAISCAMRVSRSILLLLVAGVTARNIKVSCPDDFFLVTNQCFKAVLEYRSRWCDARLECSRMNADLASPNDVGSLHEALLSRYGTGHVFWLGGSDSVSEGDWRWVSGKSIPKESWRGVQPDDCCGGEDCALLGTSWNPPLNDNNCSNMRFFVCETTAIVEAFN
ncbi:galactose-specific lectin nattectin-like isoform X2 [Penaeus japonicus]|uniref:galactose-specific lectin nattectin-like isoform X2 n=1 Tax=Penaeus japonicus TaxID=27405 RepID=UPI001C712640|nr:galactose-specific lectin nattectin-like isoform X2 [Penaeus japonicus]